MVMAPFTLQPEYWDNLQIDDQDFEFLYNHLLDLETPLTSQELSAALIEERIRKEKAALLNKQAGNGKVFAPKEHYEAGQNIQFPALEWQRGTVTSVRPGQNPDAGPFEVITVKMEKGDTREFAAGLEKHTLNDPQTPDTEDKLLNPKFVLSEYGEQVQRQMRASLEDNPDVVRIAGRWFPRSLLVDVNQGHLNLAEALLDMEGGGPLTTRALMEQVDLPTDVNAKLVEFSLNYALQEDTRFDEVGPSGEVLWFLNRLEPQPVREIPSYLRYAPFEYDRSLLTDAMLTLEAQIDDELSESQVSARSENDVTVSLIYPHWRVGTLPLTRRVAQLFPTAYEAPRIQFTFVDADSGEKFSGWVVRPNGYVFGLRDWYKSQGIIPGSLIHIKPGKNPGEVLIHAEKRRSNKEWIRTVLVGTDGGIVFAMLKQPVSAAFDERLAVAVPDMEAIDAYWSSSKQRLPFEKAVMNIMRELAKLTPQGNVHAEELYAGLNVIRRCPPGPIFALLASNPSFNHLGDLYFRIANSQEET